MSKRLVVDPVELDALREQLRESATKLRRGRRVRSRWNKATDIAVNQLLEKIGISNTTDTVDYAKYRGWTVEEIYDDLGKKKPGIKQRRG